MSTFAFDSFADFLHMGGYAFYVWLAYGIGFVILAWAVIAPFYQYQQLKRQLRQTRGHEEIAKTATVRVAMRVKGGADASTT